jgi:hypothetical protein
MRSPQESIAAAIERVLADRQRYEAKIIAHPGDDRKNVQPISCDPRLRIYVASAHGRYAFRDDRDHLPGTESDRIEVV